MQIMMKMRNVSYLKCLYL